jgi:hypothetical protein
LRDKKDAARGKSIRQHGAPSANLFFARHNNATRARKTAWQAAQLLNYLKISCTTHRIDGTPRSCAPTTSEIAWLHFQIACEETQRSGHNAPRAAH